MLRAPTERVRRTSSCLSNPARARAHGPSSARDRRGLDRAMSPALPRADLDALMSVVSRLREVAARASATPPRATRTSSRSRPRRPFSSSTSRRRTARCWRARRRYREATAAAKAALDGARLRLQNVLYEKAHIQKEIRANQDFRSAFTDEEIGLCSVDEFCAKPRRKHAKASTNTNSCSRDSATNSPNERRCASASVRSRCARADARRRS